MRSRLRKRKKKTIFIVVAVIVITICVLAFHITSNNTGENEYEQSLKAEVKNVTRLANKAWSKAYSSGKKEENEVKQYIEAYLKNEEIDVNKYYLTVYSKGVIVAKKHQAMLAKPGYYKAGTNCLEQIKDWQNLINTRGINVVEGRLGLLRKTDYKVDVVISNNITEIKSNVIENGLQIQTLVIPSSVTKIDSKAFSNAHIEEVLLDTNITELNGQFGGIKTLKKITVNGNLKTIRDKTFEETNIDEVNFIGTADQLVSIKYITYYDVPSHDKEGKLYINGVLAEEIVISENVKEIKDFALHNYSNIVKLVLPKTIEYIGTSAFVGSGIKEIEYNGTKEMWEKINKMEEWYLGGIECTVFCTDGEIVYKKGE